MSSGSPSLDLPTLLQHLANRWTVPGTSLQLGECARRVADKVRQDHLTVLAGNVAFRLVFAFFPALIAILWIMRVAHADTFVQGLLDVVRAIIPGPTTEPIQNQVQNAPQDQQTGTFSVSVAISLAVSVAAIAVAFRATMHALNTVYGVEDSRSQLRRVALSLLVSVATLSLFVSAVALIVSGTSLIEWASDHSGAGLSLRWVWGLSAWVVVLACALAGFTLTYYFAPDVKQDLRWIRAGSIVAVTTWLGFTVLFSLYVNTLATPKETYGALAGVAIFMLYVYSSAFIVLLGAEMNQVIENWEPEGKDTGDHVANV